MNKVFLAVVAMGAEACTLPDHERVIVNKDEGRWACTASNQECLIWDGGTTEAPRPIAVQFPLDLPQDILFITQEAHLSWQDLLLEQEANIALEDLEENPEFLCEDFVLPSDRETRALDEGIYVCMPSQEDWDLLMLNDASGTGDAYATTNMVYVYLSDDGRISRAFVFLAPDAFTETGGLSLNDRISTIAHELGHALGFEHPGNEISVMATDLGVAVAPLCGYEGYGIAEMYEGTPCEDASVESSQ